MKLLIIYIATCLDALRDAWSSGQKDHIGWWQWHIIKWIAFYTPLVYIVWLWFVASGYNYISLVGFTIICWLSWRYIYNKFR